MRPAILLAVLSMTAALCAGSRGISGPAPCFPSCKLDFCSTVLKGRFGTTLRTGVFDTPFTPAICRDGLIVGNVGSTGEAFAALDFEGVTDPINISDAGVGFSPSFFKSYRIPGTSMSGIGNERIKGGEGSPQALFFNAICIGVPLNSYQVLGENGHVIDNVQGGDKMTDCVGFRVYGAFDN